MHKKKITKMSDKQVCKVGWGKFKLASTIKFQYF